MKKKIIAIMLGAMVMAVMLGGCGKKEAASATENTQVEEATEVKEEQKEAEEAEEPAVEENADIAGNYVYTYEEEFDGDVMEFTNIIVLNDDNTCEVTFQDTIKGTWTDNTISLDDGSKFEFSVDGDTLNLDMDGLSFAFTKTDKDVSELLPAMDAEMDDMPMGDEEIGDYPSNDLEERLGKYSFDSYDEIISLLEGDEAYAYVDIKGMDEPVLLVANETYGNGAGGQIALAATPYTKKSDGKYTVDSTLVSGGTANPISVDDDGLIYCATHTTLEKSCYGDNGTENKCLMVMAYVYADSFDDNGDPKTVGGFIRTENKVIDNPGAEVAADDVETFKQMFKDLEKAHEIIFTTS